MTGMRLDVTGGPRNITSNNDRYLPVSAKIHRWSTASDWSRQLSLAIGTTVPGKLVYMLFGMSDVLHLLRFTVTFGYHAWFVGTAMLARDFPTSKGSDYRLIIAKLLYEEHQEPVTIKRPSLNDFAGLLV